jgi:hypothetical protein
MKLCIVLSALFGYAKGVIGLTDCDEACRCGGVVAVMVWMILLGKSIELALDFGSSGGGG